MALDLEEVRKIAQLARLDLSPEEEVTFVGQLGQILDYIDQLKEVEGVPARTEGRAPEAPDRVAPSLPIEAFLDNAPESMDHFLLVPQVKATDGE